MKNILFLFVFVALFSCNNNSDTTSSSTPEKISGDEFIYQAVDGSNIKRVRKLDTKNNILSEGFVINGIKTGEWVEYDKSKGHLVSITSYIDGKLNGNFFEFDSRGYMVTQASFLNDILDGRLIKYKFGKIIEEANYSNGKLNGKKITFNRNGNIQEEIEYKNGVLDGKMKYYNDKQELIMEYTYRNGKKISGGTVNKGIDSAPR